MYITNVTDYDNMYDDFNDTLSFKKCTIKENNFDKNLRALLFTIPCGLSFLFIEFDGIYFDQTFIQ